MIQNLWFLLAILAGFGALAMWLEGKTKWGKSLGAVNISLIIGMILVNVNLVPAWSDVHAIVFKYCVPISIALLLFKANIRDALRLGPKFLIAFGIGAAASAIGAFVAAYAFNLGPETWKVYGMYAATYIGGSANLAAVGQGLDITPSLYVPVNAADIIVFFFWMVFLFYAGKWAFFKKHFVSYKDLPHTGIELKNEAPREIKGIDPVVAMGVAITCAAIGEWLGVLTGVPAILFTTTIVLILAAYTPISKMDVAHDLGMWLFMVFFVTIGSLAVFKDLVEAGPTIFLGCATVITVHGIAIFVLAKIFKTPLEFVLISSSANVGGASTSGPLAGAYGWDDLIAPAILLGILGAAVGTYCGFGVAYILKSLLV